MWEARTLFYAVDGLDLKKKKKKQKNRPRRLLEQERRRKSNEKKQKSRPRRRRKREEEDEEIMGGSSARTMQMRELGIWGFNDVHVYLYKNTIGNQFGSVNLVF